MKHVHLLLCLCLLASVSAHAQNDNSEPLTLVGSSLIVHDESFLWLEATDDGIYRTDIYLTSDTSYSVSVVTKLGNPQLATVSGDSPFGLVDGFFSGGLYNDNYVENGTPGTDPVWETWTYSVNLANNQVYWEHEGASNDGSISSSFREDSAGSWSERSDSYDSYSGSSWSESWGTGGMGNTNRITTGTRSGGSSTEQNLSSVTLAAFGRQFAITSSQSNWETESVHGVNTRNYSSTTESYSDGDSSLTVSMNNNTVTTTSVSGWTPEIGNFSATLPGNGVSNWNTVAWDPRDGPTFAPSNFSLNGWLVTWQSGTLSSDGVVTDTYAGAAGLLQMSISGNVREVDLGNASAQVRIQGAVAGSVNGSENFSLTGWTVSTAEAGSSSNVPFFLPGAVTLWVDGIAYGFVTRYSDENGGHVDTYSANSGEGQLCLAGTVQGVALLAGNQFTTFFNGSLSNGAFNIAGQVLSVTSQPPAAALPQALWVRGRFYSQLAETPGTYRWQTPGGSASFTLTAAPVGSGFQIAGTDDIGVFSGILPVGGGLHFLYAGAVSSAPQSVPIHEATTACAPSTAGGDLSSYPGTPLAVEVAGSILVFSGVLTSPPRAVYVPVDLSTSNRYLELRLDTHVVTLTDHATEPVMVLNGSYDADTHLFSTSHAMSTLPEYLHAADPEASYAHLHLPLPSGSDLPPSFLVRGDPWWFAGWHEETNVATYRGFYDGQMMTVASAVPLEGGPTDRLVTLVDPVHNASQANPEQETLGTLSDVRRSVRMRDGTTVLSGNSFGQQQTISIADDFTLHTIRSDVDIIGNNLSFGVLRGDASLAGAVFQFADSLYFPYAPYDTEYSESKASLHSMLSRRRAEWAWWKAGEGVENAPQQVMHLDVDHRLRLQQLGNSAVSGIILDPVGPSKFNSGPVRVWPAGDVPMAEQFQVGPRPDE